LKLDGKTRGKIIVRAEAIQESNKVIKWEISGQGIKNKVGGCCGMG